MRVQGKYEDVNQEAKKIFALNTFEGLRLEYQRGLSQSFGVGHNIALQPAADQFGTYDFAANYSNGKVSFAVDVIQAAVS